MDRGTGFIRGPMVKFRVKSLVRSGYILTENETGLIVWSDGKPVRVKKNQILFRE